MCKNKTKSNKTREERMGMAVLAKPINKVSVVKEKDSQEFVREFNKNKVTKEFVESCKKASDLFAGKK